MSQSSKSSQQVDLTKLFTTVTKTLKENQVALNPADEENHNHGDNMVQSFQLITKATREMKGSSPSAWADADARTRRCVRDRWPGPNLAPLGNQFQ